MKDQRKVLFLIIIAALGYFVDIYDLVLFGVVKAESLATIMPEATNELRASTGKFLFNIQMLGMQLKKLFHRFPLWKVKLTHS